MGKGCVGWKVSMCSNTEWIHVPPKRTKHNIPAVAQIPTSWNKEGSWDQAVVPDSALESRTRLLQNSLVCSVYAALFSLGNSRLPQARWQSLNPVSQAQGSWIDNAQLQALQDCSAAFWDSQDTGSLNKLAEGFKTLTHQFLSSSSTAVRHICPSPHESKNSQTLKRGLFGFLGGSDPRMHYYPHKLKCTKSERLTQIRLWIVSAQAINL